MNQNKPTPQQLSKACWKHCERIQGFAELTWAEKMEVYKAMWELAENIKIKAGA